MAANRFPLRLTRRLYEDNEPDPRIATQELAADLRRRKALHALLKDEAEAVLSVSAHWYVPETGVTNGSGADGLGDSEGDDDREK